MVDSVSSSAQLISTFYSSLISSLPHWAQTFINLFLLSIVVVLYSMFIWKLHKWIARKDILRLNLSRFNKSEHSVISKFIGILIYFLEYILILPLVISIWFGVFAFFLLILARIQMQTVLLVSVIIVASIRMTAYYKKGLSENLAILVPFNLLAYALVYSAGNSGILNFQSILNQIHLIPSLLSNIWIYILFIVALEFFLRIIYTILLAFDFSTEEETEIEN